MFHFIPSHPVLFNSFKFLPELRTLVHFIFELNLVNLHQTHLFILIMCLYCDSDLHFPTSLSGASFFKKEDLALRSTSWQQLMGSEMARRKMKRKCMEIYQSSFAFLCAHMHKMMIAGVADLGNCYSYDILTLYFLNPDLNTGHFLPSLSIVVHRPSYFQNPPLRYLLDLSAPAPK